MSLMQDDHVVQAFAANTPNEPLGVRILPWTPWGDHHFLNVHVPHSLPERCAVDVVPISHEIPWRLVPRKGFQDLLRSPCGGGMFGDVKVDDLSSLVGQNQYDEQHLVSDRWHDKEIQSHRVLHVILQKGLPCWRRRPLRSDAILLHRRLGHLDAQLAQLADDPWCTPGRIALPHGADEIADVFGNRWTAGRAWLAQLSPVVAKALALPGDDGTGLNERQGVLPGRPEPREPPPEQTIAWAKSRAMDCLFIDR